MLVEIVSRCAKLLLNKIQLPVLFTGQKSIGRIEHQTKQLTNQPFKLNNENEHFNERNQVLNAEKFSFAHFPLFTFSFVLMSQSCAHFARFFLLYLFVLSFALAKYYLRSSLRNFKSLRFKSKSNTERIYNEARISLSFGFFFSFFLILVKMNNERQEMSNLVLLLVIPLSSPSAHQKVFYLIFTLTNRIHCLKRIAHKYTSSCVCSLQRTQFTAREKTKEIIEKNHFQVNFERQHFACFYFAQFVLQICKFTNDRQISARIFFLALGREKKPFITIYVSH